MAAAVNAKQKSPEGKPDAPANGIYRGRLAPSPTGLLHVGHARTFWAAYTRARDVMGTLVMRMDDLDQERSKPQYAEAAFENLRWLGIRWQEGPGSSGQTSDNSETSDTSESVDGAYGPYFQSQRQMIYRDAFCKLQQLGVLYACRCSRRELAMAASAPHEGQGQNGPPGLDDEPIYPGTCRPGPQESLDSEPEAANWRFRVTDGTAVEFYDQRLGLQRFVAGEDFGDFLVWRRDNVPSYQLACTVDDTAMAITEVVRGADLLKSTARQILLYRALGWTPPAWYHCALVADEKGQRLAKRYDALAIETLRERGLKPADLLSAELQRRYLL